MKGLTNNYSSRLIGIMLSLITLGSLAAFYGYYVTGLILIIPGVMMFQGFKELSGADPREMGLIKFFGTRTDVTVSGLTFLLDWLPIEIVGVAIFNMQQEDKNFPVKSIRCYDGVRLTGGISLALAPDPNNLGAYDDAKQMKGVQEQAGEALTVWLQEIVEKEKTPDGNEMTYKWVESHSKELGDIIRLKLENGNDLLNLKNLGVIIKKLAVKLEPISKKIIDADEDRIVEQLQRQGELEDTETVNRQVQKRFDRYLQEWKENASIGPKPTFQACRKEIFDERLAKDGKYTKNVNEGGINVVQSHPTQS